MVELFCSWAHGVLIANFVRARSHKSKVVPICQNLLADFVVVIDSTTDLQTNFDVDSVSIAIQIPVMFWSWTIQISGSQFFSVSAACNVTLGSCSPSRFLSEKIFEVLSPTLSWAVHVKHVVN